MKNIKLCIKKQDEVLLDIPVKLAKKDKSASFLRNSLNEFIKNKENTLNQYNEITLIEGRWQTSFPDEAQISIKRFIGRLLSEGNEVFNNNGIYWRVYLTRKNQIVISGIYHNEYDFEEYDFAFYNIIKKLPAKGSPLVAYVQFEDDGEIFQYKCPDDIVKKARDIEIMDI